MTSPKEQPVTDGVLAMLRATLAPVLVGDGVAPDPPGGAQEPLYPYAVLYPISGGGFEGAPNSASPEALATWIYQVTVVGLNRGQVEFVKDKVHAAMLDRDANDFVHAIAVSGASTGPRSHDSHVPMDRSGKLWSGGERFAVGCALTNA